MTAAIPEYSAAPSTLNRSVNAPLPEPEIADPPGQSAAPPIAPSGSWLFAWAAARSGFRCVVAIGRETPATADLPGSPAARGKAAFAVHLQEAVPLAILVSALGQLKRRGGAVLLLAEKNSAGYRESLRIDDRHHVLAIQRTFAHAPAGAGRQCLLGVAWKITERAAPLMAPLEGPCWRTARAVLRRGNGKAAREIFSRPAEISDAKSDLVAQLTPASLTALARDLGYRQVRNFCFAAPAISVADDAVLREPLFISGPSAITGEHVHIGPGWIVPDSPTVTFPSRPQLDGPQAGPENAHSASPPRLPYFVGPGTTRRPRYDKFKRMLDVPFALAALAATLPICIVAAIIIKLYDRGPIFFVHRRESLDGRPFGCLKFRTMVRDADALQRKLRAGNEVDGPQFKLSDDPRITLIGRFLRKTNIDELPQFINVLLGHMSVVGPRPSPFKENQLCPAWREARLSVKPGITGLWQVSRSRERGATDFQEWIFYDTQYVERRGFWLDIKIILLTIKELFGKGQ